MPNYTVADEIDDLLRTANFAAFRSTLGLGALSTVTPGANVATALAIAVGSAGGLVVINGAGGTPSSLTLTNATGLPIGSLANSAAGADRLLMWDQSANDWVECTLGTNLSFSGTTLNASGGGGSGDVSGPVSSTDSAVALWDGTGGDTLKNSVVVINGSGDVTGVRNLTATGTVDLSAANTVLGNMAFSGALASDDTYNGPVISGVNAGATVAQWEAVYLSGSSTWLLADANGSGTYPARGLAVTGGTNGNPLSILQVGTVRNNAWDWTPGGTIYLSGTAGALTQTAPNVSGDKVQQVGFAITADIAYFNFNSETVTVA